MCRQKGRPKKLQRKVPEVRWTEGGGISFNPLTSQKQTPSCCGPQNLNGMLGLQKIETPKLQELQEEQPKPHPNRHGPLSSAGGEKTNII